MSDLRKIVSTLPMLIFGIPFLLIGGLMLYFAWQGKTFAQPLEKMSDVLAVGALGVAFLAVGVCATISAVAGRTRPGRMIASFLMATHLGFLGLVFLVVGIFDPESIKSSTTLPLIGDPGWKLHFGVGATLFVIVGLGMLSQMPRIYRITLKRLEEIANS